ncbi:MAG: PHP domain-containing protein [Methanomassiliicoccus sp.]|nr:PHP domain-containing protein [Methanomassiliicoccus sp.]
MGTDPLMNLHTHTRFSDGDFTAEQIIITAAEHHLSHIGITDHLMTDKCRSMFAGDLGNYIDVLRELGRRHRHIDVLAGVEIDTRPDHCDLESLPIDDLNRLDYVLFEFVQTKEGTSLENLEPLLKDINVPCGLAHNDLEKNFAPWGPEAVADYLSTFDIFVEVNTAWPYKRDGLMFWERAERYYQAFTGKVLVSVGTDVHHSLAEVYNLDKAYHFLRRVGLMDDLVVR